MMKITKISKFYISQQHIWYMQISILHIGKNLYGIGLQTLAPFPPPRAEKNNDYITHNKKKYDKSTTI